jgi:hypothetical protein
MIAVDCKDGVVKEIITHAIYHIPPPTRLPLDSNTKIVTTHGRFGYCMSALKDARIIVINERAVPQTHEKADPIYRWFICVVLHEIAHAHHEHKEMDNPVEEAEAWKTAIEWYNSYAPIRHNVPKMEKAEIDATEVIVKAQWRISSSNS